jgi:hypothetical protein
MSSFLSNFLEMLVETFKDGLLGAIIVVLILITVCILLVVIFREIFIIFDKVFSREKRGEGKVVEKYFTPAHDETRFISTGDTLIPYRSHNPNEYGMDIEIEGKKDYAIVKKKFHLSCSVG